MDLTMWTLFGVLGVIAVNQLVMRVAGLRGRAAVFYPLQILNLIVGAGVLWFGLPGFTDLPVIGWMVGLLLLFRVVQNNSQRAAHLRDRADEAEVEARREALAAALRRSED